jgi:recombination protein RecT
MSTGNNGQGAQQGPAQNAQNQSNLPATQTPITTEKTVDNVLEKIAAFQSAGELKLPPNYSPENAVRSAWLIIQDVKDASKRPALQVCTRDSIATALLDMVMQGLSPVKKQCYFIVYGDKLTCMKSYIGTVAISKRVANVKEPIANVVYEKDEFQYEINTVSGRKTIVKHIQKMEKY